MQEFGISVIRSCFERAITWSIYIMKIFKTANETFETELYNSSGHISQASSPRPLILQFSNVRIRNWINFNCNFFDEGANYI